MDTLGFGFLSIIDMLELILYNRVLESCIFFAIDRNFFKNDKLDSGKGLVVGFCKTFRIRRLTWKPRKSRYLTVLEEVIKIKTGLNFYPQDNPDSVNLIF
jgi:hypothetical protein